MVASQAVLAESPVHIALALIEQMEALARACDWEHIEDVAIRLRGAVMDIPESERGPILVAAQHGIERVAAAAHQARKSITGEIHGLRKGQEAKKAYELG